MKRPEDIPEDIWQAAEAAGEAMHGRHERGWVAWPLIPAHGRASHQEIMARALLAERQAATAKEREACAKQADDLGAGFEHSADLTMRDWVNAPGNTEADNRSNRAYAREERQHAVGARAAAQAIRSRP